MSSGNPSSKKSSAAAGRRMAGGAEYQSRVAAWCCVQILAEQDVATNWGLSSGETFEAIECHGMEHVDDVIVYTSLKRRFLFNVKHGVKHTTIKDGDFAKFTDQAVRQFLENQASGINTDRIFLITSLRSHEIIRIHLRTLLDRIRTSSQKPLSKIPVNESEQKVLATFKALTDSSWKQETNFYPTETQFKDFLGSIWVEVLDVDDRQGGEGNAQFILNRILAEGNKKGESVWGELVKLCLNDFSLSFEANRKSLLSALTRLGYRFKTQPSFAADVAKLKAESERTFELMREFSVIEVGKTEIKIDRPVRKALLKAAETGSVIVIGDPGSGKSGVVYDFVNELRNRKDVVFLAVEQLDATSRSTFRDDLNLEHDFTEVLRNWTGAEPGYLVIDALDASRDLAKLNFLNKLIADVIRTAERWRVIVSIRQFDLRYNTQLHGLFAGEPVEGHQSLEFPNLRHIFVDKLGVEELVQVPQKHNSFLELFSRMTVDLLLLVQIPFNLKLLGRLFGNGFQASDLNPLRTQIQLLELYWKEIVLDSSSGMANDFEWLLAKVVELMVGRRQLKLYRPQVEAISAGSGNILDEILHRNILSEWQAANGMAERNVVNFPHHVMFDYAVARLFLRGTENTALEKLENDQQLVLAIRPSIIYHFRYELLKGERNFWEHVFRIIKSENIPSIGKLMGPSVAVDSAQSIDFFVLLFEKLASSDPEEKSAGEQALKHIARELRFRSTLADDTTVSGKLDLWLNLLEKLSEILSPLIAANISYVLWLFFDRIKFLSEEQFKVLGKLSRRLLRYALTLPYYNFFLVTNAITYVARSFSSNVAESVQSLTPILNAGRVTEYGHHELDLFADHLESLGDASPEFVAAIYRAAFVNSDHSEEKTSIHRSRILNLTSTRRQDFMLMQDNFKNRFGKFLKQSPLVAVEALIDIFDVFAQEAYQEWLESTNIWHSIMGSGYQDEEYGVSRAFDFKGHVAYIRSDGSRNWNDRLCYSRETHQEMLEIFQNYFSGLCEDGGNAELRNTILDLLAERNQNALFWRKIIKCGTEFPETFGREIRSLAWTPEVLANPDTIKVIGSYLKTNYSKFTDQEREVTEKAILSLPNFSGKNESSLDERDYLIECLDENYVRRDEVRTIIAEMKEEAEKELAARTAAQAAGSQLQVSDFAEEIYSADTIDLYQDVDTSIEKTVGEQLKEFYQNYNGEPPSLEKVRAILPVIKEAYESLKNLPDEQSLQKSVTEQWGYLTKSCSVVVEYKGIEKEPEIFRLLSEILLAASMSINPEPTENPDENLEEFPSWKFPCVRGDSGLGLVRLARFEMGCDEEVLSRIKELGRNDPAPVVRHQVMRQITSLYYPKPELMWEILEHTSIEENNIEALTHAVQYSLLNLAPFHPERTFDLTKSIYNRFLHHPEAQRLRKNCLHVFIKLDIQCEHCEAKEIVEWLTDNAGDFMDEAFDLVHSAGAALNVGRREPDDQKKRRIRQKSFKILESIARSAQLAFENFDKILNAKEFTEWTEEEISKYRQFPRLIDLIILKVYFAAGADHQQRYNSRHEDAVPDTDEEKRQFWNEARETLSVIADSGFAEAIYRLVEALNYLFSSSPREAFFILGKAIESGKRQDFQSEWMAVPKVLSLIERILGEHSDLLKNQEREKIMIRMLDTFVEAGWEGTHKLTYRLNDIYR